MKNNFSNNIKLVEDIFDMLNQKLFDGKIRATISIYSGDTNLNDCIDRSKAYVDKEVLYREIKISEEDIENNDIHIITSMLTQMIIIEGDMIGEKRTSNRDIYKNIRFKRRAEEIGLIVRRGQRYGWNEVFLSNPLKEMVKKYRFETKNKYINTNPTQDYTSIDGKKRLCHAKSSTIRWVCPMCGNIVRTTKIQSVICGECNIPFERALCNET